MKNQYHGWARIFVYIAVATFAIGLALVGVGGEDAWVAGMMGMLLSPGMLLVAGVLWFHARKADTQLATFRGGNHLAHWTYSAEEWQRFSIAERERSRKQGMWYVLGFALAGGLLVGPLLMEQVGLVALPLFAAAGAAVGWGILAAVRRSEELRDRTLTVYEAFIGPDSAYCGGRYFAWTGLGTRLDGMEFLPGDPNALQVTFSVQSKGGRTPYHYRIPVPAGREDEARRVIGNFGC